MHPKTTAPDGCSLDTARAQVAVRKREVDAHGNCSKCGGTHYGTGWYCPMPESFFTQQENAVDEQQVAGQLPKYKCQEVWALKIKAVTRQPHGNASVRHMIVPADDGYAPFEVAPKYIEKHSPQAGGYYVVYMDGYISYSPAGAFEEGYTRI